jgi:hypothetical protein
VTANIHKFFKIRFVHLNRINSQVAIGFGTKVQAERYAKMVMKKSNKFFDHVITCVDSVPAGLNYGAELINLMSYDQQVQDKPANPVVLSDLELEMA